MEKLTRTKKYADLRQKIKQDAEVEIKTKELSQYANKLNNIDKNNFDKMEVASKSPASKLYTKKLIFNTAENKIVDSENDDNITEVNTDDIDIEEIKETNDEYIAKYIDEVKEYNKEKGLLLDTNTQLNVIKNIRNKPGSDIIRPFGDIDLEKGIDLSVNRKSHQPKQVETADALVDDDNEEEITNSISLEISTLLKDMEKNDIIDTTTVRKVSEESEEANDQELFDESNIMPLSEKQPEQIEKSDLETSEKVEKPTEESEEIISETDLKNVTAVEETESNVDINDDIDYSNKDGVINFFIILLFIILLIVVGIFLYFILLDKGVI